MRSGVPCMHHFAHIASVLGNDAMRGPESVDSSVLQPVAMIMDN